MKIRNGYVSNSSSSSFIIAGKYIGNFTELKEKDLEFNEEHEYIVIGRDLSDGNDWFQITPDIWKYYNENQGDFNEKGYFNGSVYDVLFVGEDMIDITVEEMLKKKMFKINVTAFEADYHNTENLEDFKERYF